VNDVIHHVFIFFKNKNELIMIFQKFYGQLISAVKRLFGRLISGRQDDDDIFNNPFVIL